MTRFSRDYCVFRGINTDEIFKYLIKNRFILEEFVCGLKKEKSNRFVVSLIEKKKKTISLSGVQNNSKAKRELHDSSNALDPTRGFMQYLEHFQFLEYLLGLKMKGVGIQVSEDQVLMSSKV